MENFGGERFVFLSVSQQGLGQHKGRLEALVLKAWPGACL